MDEISREELHNLSEDVNALREEMGRMAFRMNYLEDNLLDSSHAAHLRKQRAILEIENFRKRNPDG